MARKDLGRDSKVYGKMTCYYYGSIFDYDIELFLLKNVLWYAKFKLQNSPIFTVPYFMGGCYGTRKEVSGFKFK